MSNYRDDSIDILVVSDMAIAKIKQGDSETLKIRDEAFITVRSNVVESAKITDQDISAQMTITVEDMHIADAFNGIKRAKMFVTDSIAAVDTSKQWLVVREDVIETIGIADEVRDTVSAFITDTMRIADTPLAKVTTSAKVVDTVKVADSTLNTVRQFVGVEESVQISDAISDRTLGFVTDTIGIADDVTTVRRTSIRLVDGVVISDSVNILTKIQLDESFKIDDSMSLHVRANGRISDAMLIEDSVDNHPSVIRQFVEDSIFVADTITSKLTAVSRPTETIFIEDFAKSGVAGAAWTSNVDSWAMSRYADYPFNQLVTIDGRLYGVNDDGVYLMEDDNIIDAQLKTGKIDLSGGRLVHPLAAFLEYELQGQLTVDVTTTQSGTAQTYNYRLPSELANELTNGRVQFGRGLRGRHFSFGVNITASKAHVNALRIDMTDTNRRI